MDQIFQEFASNFVPNNYLTISLDAKKNVLKKFRIILEKKKIPKNGWKDDEIEEFINYISSLDSNNFPVTCGIGEREGRIACKLVARRHLNFSHGIGRSGDLLESQPKAAGSSLLSTLTNSLVLDYIKNIAGVKSTASCFIVPVATGMALSLCFLTLRKQKPDAKYILWSRIDQKSAFKTITTSGFIPIIIEQQLDASSELHTNVKEFENQINVLGPDNILCIYSTTSCFAPRNTDNLEKLAMLAKGNEIFHIVNNAYGLQCSKICHIIEEAQKNGRIDLFVQSTDKNFLVPVGGSIIAGFREEQVKNVAKTYVGRASSSQTLDVLLTILSLGESGFKELLAERKNNFIYLNENLKILAESLNETIIKSVNPISIGMTLSSLNINDVTKLGSMLFKRGITGARVISCTDSKTIDNYKFDNWNSHYTSNNPKIPYITAAAALGMKKDEVDVFCSKLKECYLKCKNSLEVA
ncbi:O-phosphoseryl-tRNA(Sec) selenium transferase [Condylostylus longicornis]|uniref:O-phosphoseryl-tRNA(Sec) selenium transferase n=1 Tax=Condylostylus longicornis TaxID=2530218 RepID=UPI00244E2EE9|nr:O-phosphoseryl-tRNA(Sec) selenium transferase [Condylostylus longicornis]